MSNARFELGAEKLKEIDGIGGENVIQSLQDIAPDVGKYIMEFAFGDVYTRPELSMQEREMITITSLLTTGGCEPQLEVHINGSLNVGLSPEKIIETFIQCIPYTGFPQSFKCHLYRKENICRKAYLLEKLYSQRCLRDGNYRKQSGS